MTPLQWVQRAGPNGAYIVVVCHGTNSSLIPLHAYLLSLEKELVVVQIVLVGFDVGGSASTD